MKNPEAFIHPTAEVSDTSRIGSGTRIWHQAQVMQNVIIGEECTLGKGVFIGSACVIGKQVKLGNYANVFGGTIEDEAFIGPMVCILQDRNPRSTNFNGTRKSHTDYASLPPIIRRGASVGAASVIMPGVSVGRYAMISAGSVVNKDVPDYAIMVGNPARQVGYVCRCGMRLDANLTCESQHVYRLVGETLELVSAD